MTNLVEVSEVVAASAKHLNKQHPGDKDPTNAPIKPTQRRRNHISSNQYKSCRPRIMSARKKTMSDSTNVTLAPPTSSGVPNPAEKGSCHYQSHRPLDSARTRCCASIDLLRVAGAADSPNKSAGSVQTLRSSRCPLFRS